MVDPTSDLSFLSQWQTLATSEPFALADRLVSDRYRACIEATPAIQKVLDDFWGPGFEVRFLGLSPKQQYYWRLENFYVSQTAVAEAPLQLRLSESACGQLFDPVLGRSAKPGKPFALGDLSGFETYLLHSFSQDVFKSLIGPMVKVRRKSIPPSRLQLHAVWTVTPRLPPGVMAPDQIGKLVITLPHNLIRIRRLPLCEAKADQVALEHYLSLAHAVVQIHIGRARLTIDDIEGLEPGDLVTIERSRRDRFYLKASHLPRPLPFSIHVPPRQVMELPPMPEYSAAAPSAYVEPGSASLSAVDPRESLWDNLLIDVQAEFQPTRIPLKHLKQVAEGVIVEVGDLLHNRVRLHVEGKTLAEGELVIVGDKFGVLIQRMAISGSASSGTLNDDPLDESSPVSPMGHYPTDPVVAHATPTVQLPAAAVAQSSGMADAADPIRQELAEAWPEVPAEPAGALTQTLDDTEASEAMTENLMDEVDRFLNEDFDENDPFDTPELDLNDVEEEEW